MTSTDSIGEVMVLLGATMMCAGIGLMLFGQVGLIIGTGIGIGLGEVINVYIDRRIYEEY